MYELNEILWEFTLKCNKNCSYCGSKNILNQTKSKFTHEEIAKSIISVNPKTVTITGGEPSTEFKELIKCIKLLKEAGICIKVLTNGNLFTEYQNYTNKCNIDIDEMIDQYGLSVNTLEDIETLKNNPYFLKYNNKITMITNFGIHNIDNLFELAKFAVQFSCWQIQLTIGNEYQLDLNQIKDLQDKLNNVKNSGLLDITLADNFTCGKCLAGISGFSITYDGNIIPCLSYRAWKSNLNIQGTIENIKEIWENGFKFNREREFVPCCKTISGIEKINNKNEVINIIEELKNKGLNPNPITPNPITPPEPVYMYGVVIPKENKNPPYIAIYGVSLPNNQVTLYSNNTEYLINRLKDLLS